MKPFPINARERRLATWLRKGRITEEVADNRRVFFEQVRPFFYGYIGMVIFLITNLFLDLPFWIWFGVTTLILIGRLFMLQGSLSTRRASACILPGSSMGSKRRAVLRG